MLPMTELQAKTKLLLSSLHCNRQQLWMYGRIQKICSLESERRNYVI